MLGRVKGLAGIGIIAALLAVNIGLVSAHPHPRTPADAHWNRTGSQIIIQSQVTGSTPAEAEAARVDAWNKIGILYNYRVNYHTDVSVFDGNFGATGWSGLMSIESSSWSGGHFHILHAHARYNSYWGGAAPT